MMMQTRRRAEAGKAPDEETGDKVRRQHKEPQ